MEHNQFWELLAKVNAGEASPEEQLEFNQALLRSTEYQDLAREMTIFWNMPLPAAQEAGPEETGRKWDQLRRQILPRADSKGILPLHPEKKKNHVASWYRLSAAAIILFLISSSVWWWKGHDIPASGKNNIVSTRYGSKSKIELPDGTQVWLNGGSRLVYKANYGRDSREVELEGEAYFDVIRDPGHPFLVHTRDIDIRVLGTIFNVQAYPNDQVSEASLIKGSIEVSFPGRQAGDLILKPDQKITVVHGDNPGDIAVTANTGESTAARSRPSVSLSLSSVTYQPVDSSILETAWTKNELVFRSKAFEDLAKDLQRWYNTSIQCTDSVILHRRFTGTFSNESITEALDALKLSYPFQYHFDKQNNIITIASH